VTGRQRPWAIVAGIVATVALIGGIVAIAADGDGSPDRSVSIGARDGADEISPASTSTTEKDAPSSSTSTSTPDGTPGTPTTGATVGGRTTGGVYAPPVVGEPVVPTSPPLVYEPGGQPVDPGATPPTDAPPSCSVSVQGFSIVASGCASVTASPVNFYYSCPAGTDLPATIPGGTVITVCPALLGSTSGGEGAYSPPAGANCMNAYIVEAQQFVGFCG
jgi:hypothetical protein